MGFNLGLKKYKIRDLENSVPIICLGVTEVMLLSFVSPGQFLKYLPCPGFNKWGSSLLFCWGRLGYKMDWPHSGRDV